MPAHRPRKHNALQVTAPRHQILHLVAMRNPRHILLDDRPLVEHLGHVVAGRANQLYAARVRRVVGFGSGKSRQKRVMHIDDPCRKLCHKIRRQNLHVPRQHHQIHIVLVHQPQLQGFGFGACRRRHRRVLEGNPVEPGQILNRCVV